jgi:hypothetical protein
MLYRSVIIASITDHSSITDIYYESSITDIYYAVYNQSMGRVDKLDQMVSYYRVFIQSKKWTLQLVLQVIDLGVANRWFEHTEAQKAPKSKKSMNALAFCLEVAESLIMSKEVAPMS